MTAQQLLTRNVSERIVDKDNHARDAMKYLVMSLPSQVGDTEFKQLRKDPTKNEKPYDMRSHDGKESLVRLAVPLRVPLDHAILAPLDR